MSAGTIAAILAKHQPKRPVSIFRGGAVIGIAQDCEGCDFGISIPADGKESVLWREFGMHQADMIEPALATVKAAAEQWAGQVEYMADVAAEDNPENAQSFRMEAAEIHSSLMSL